MSHDRLVAYRFPEGLWEKQSGSLGAATGSVKNLVLMYYRKCKSLKFCGKGWIY